MPHRFHDSSPLADGRLTLYADPVPGMSYSLGLDFAFGIPGKDFDAGILFDSSGDQVATLEGHWGMGFTPHVKSLVEGFGGRGRVFITGEAAATGLPVLRALYDAGYTWMYFNRREESRGRQIQDKLGHVPVRNDPTVLKLQASIRAREIKVRDAALHSQLCKFGFRPRSAAVSQDDATTSDQMTWGAPDREHDDLVRACALANAGLEWMPQFVPPPAAVQPGTIGAMLARGKDAEPPTRKNYWSR